MAQKLKSTRAARISRARRAEDRKRSRAEDFEILTGMFSHPVAILFTDGSRIETTPHDFFGDDVIDQRIDHYVEEARKGNPYPIKAELLEIEATEDIEFDGMTLSIDAIKEYSPLALAICNGSLARLQDKIEADQKPKKGKKK